MLKLFSGERIDFNKWFWTTGWPHAIAKMQDLNVKTKTIILLEENIGLNLHDWVW